MKPLRPAVWAFRATFSHLLNTALVRAAPELRQKAGPFFITGGEAAFQDSKASMGQSTLSDWYTSTKVCPPFCFVFQL